MPNILLIETSSSTCSVAIFSDNKTLIQHAFSDGMKHAEKLPLFIQECMAYTKTNKIILDAVAVSGGPGSYTGLRIGVSHAKGLCYGLNIPLIAIDTLEIIARKALTNTQTAPQMVCPMVDARRMEVYCTLFSHDFTCQLPHQAKVIDELSFADFLDKGTVLFCGNGAPKCEAIINHENAIFEHNTETTTEDMGDIAERIYNNREFADLAYYEPFYLKEFYINPN